MRIALAALTAALLASASPASAQDAASWSYAYSGGQAVATERDGQGQVLATIACSPPTGDLVIASYPLSRVGGGNKDVTISIGDFSMQASGRVDRAVDGQRALIVHLPQSPPVIAGGRAANALMTVAVGGRRHVLAPGAGQRMSDIAVACWSAT